MQPGLMKNLGIALLAVGVVVCAGSGAQLGSEEFSAAVNEGRAVLGDTVASPLAGPSTSPAARLVDWYAVAGVPFLIGLMLLTAGAVIARVAIGRDGVTHGVGDGADYTAGLERLADGLFAARASLDAADAEPAAVRQRLERLQLDVLEPMIDARAGLQRRLGLAGYAAVFGPLSGAERLLNRAWSALVDGHVGEGRTSLTGALAEVEAAREALQSLA